MKGLPASLAPLWEAATAALTEGRLGDAVGALQRLLRVVPGYAAGWNNLGVALRRLRRWEAAEACFQRGLGLPGGNTESGWSNLGNALRDVGRFVDAEVAFHRALKAGGAVGTQYNYALLLRDMNRVDEAIAVLGPLVAAGHGGGAYRWDYALMLLQKGDWEAGFAAYESRWELSDVPKCASDRPVWRGEPLSGKTLAILSEQGMGDMIQFARFVPAVIAMGGHVVMQVRPPLLRLFAQIPALVGVRLVSVTDPLPHHDLMSPVGSLPLVLHARPETLPPPLAFSLPEDQIAAAAKALPPRMGRRRVGIVWAGSPGHRNDRHRSAPLSAFLPLFRHPGLDLYSFQVGARAADLADSGLGVVLTDLSSRLGDFSDTAAYLRQIDVLVAVDTGIVHLAGSLGVPTLVVTPQAVDWRWGGIGTTPPWYASLRIVRQTRQGDWDGAFAQVLALLAHPAPLLNERKE
ncbi:MAG: glycosyltransferase family protein [Rhodospirillaceae bacterium]|nr:glycosyltransferase family protein [Rhodospirillaceae bacterium]